MAKQTGQPRDDGQAQPQSAIGRAAFGVEPVKLIEDALLLVGRDADPGIPHGDAQPGPRAPAAQQHGPAARVAHRVGDQVAEDALEQHWIAGHPGVARANAQLQPLVPRGRRVRHVHAVEQALYRERLHLRADDARVQLGHVQQRPQQSIGRGDGLRHRIQQWPRRVRRLSLQS